LNGWRHTTKCLFHSTKYKFKLLFQIPSGYRIPELSSAIDEFLNCFDEREELMREPWLIMWKLFLQMNENPEYGNSRSDNYPVLPELPDYNSKYLSLMALNRDTLSKKSKNIMLNYMVWEPVLQHYRFKTRWIDLLIICK
jgi:hypothetical protein